MAARISAALGALKACAFVPAFIAFFMLAFALKAFAFADEDDELELELLLLDDDEPPP